MATTEKSVKKYVVCLSAEEPEQLEALIRKGKSAAKRLLKAGFCSRQTCRRPHPPIRICKIDPELTNSGKIPRRNSQSSR